MGMKPRLDLDVWVLAGVLQHLFHAKLCDFNALAFGRLVWDEHIGNIVRSSRAKQKRPSLHLTTVTVAEKLWISATKLIGTVIPLMQAGPEAREPWRPAKLIGSRTLWACFAHLAQAAFAGSVADGPSKLFWMVSHCNPCARKFRQQSRIIAISVCAPIE